MGARENKVERYLDACVKDHGGLTRKWTSPGVSGVPDRIVICKGHIWFVEVKTVDGRLSQPQIREIARLEHVGARCRVVYGQAGVDRFIEELHDAVTSELP